MTPDYINDTVAAGQNWTDLYTGWTFEDEPASPGAIEKVSYDFWSGYSDYSVDWYYDATSDKFLRSHGGEEHLDLNNGKRIAAANVVVLLTEETGPINEKKHMLYETTGTGDALIFKHGDVIEATWQKKSRTAELQFIDAVGDPVEMARGLTWISIIDMYNEVSY